MSSQCACFHLPAHTFDELRTGYHVLLASRAPASDRDRSCLGLPLADHRHVRNLVGFGVPDPVAQRLRPVIQAGPQTRLLHLGHEGRRIIPDGIGDREHTHLLGREPHRERARVVLDQPADEALHRAEQRAVDHHGAVLGVVLSLVCEL